jgi:hypothetical protein
LVVTFLRYVKNSNPPSPVISKSPNLESLIPPKENGSRGTGTLYQQIDYPIFTPIIPAENLSEYQSAMAPLLVYIHAKLIALNQRFHMDYYFQFG